jgi:Response regulator containing a CheY-like receiver domain and an HTH DNA-binding domain
MVFRRSSCCGEMTLETRVVFLTMHRDDEFVAAAINAGAHGYVLKSRIHLDLISAIDHALAGRLFVPSLTSLSLSQAAGTRPVPCQRQPLPGRVKPAGWCDTAVGRADRHRHQRSEPHWRRSAPAGAADERRMLAERGQYVAQDSALALSQVMHDGRPDKERLAEMIHGLDRCAWPPRMDRGRLTIVGDMSAPCAGTAISRRAGARTDLERLDTRVAVFHGLQLPDRLLRELRSPGSALERVRCAQRSHVRNFARRSRDMN